MSHNGQSSSKDYLPDICWKETGRRRGVEVRREAGRERNDNLKQFMEIKLENSSGNLDSTAINTLQGTRSGKVLKKV